MNELLEGCSHDCENCFCCDGCYYYNNVSISNEAIETGSVKDMVETEVWNKNNLCFEKKFVYEMFLKN